MKDKKPSDESLWKARELCGQNHPFFQMKPTTEPCDYEYRIATALDCG